MNDEARVASVMMSLTIYHRCLSMSKSRLEIFLDRIMFELKTTNVFFAFTVENTTLKTPIEYFGGMTNCFDDLSSKVWVFSVRSMFVDHVNEKKEYILWGPTIHNVIVS